MSTPKNPMDRFRTYSYHHIIIICDNTRTAESIAQDDNISKFLQTTDDDLDGERSAIIDSNSGGRYVILSNGLTDGRYSVDTLTWESVVDRFGDSGTDNYTSMDSEGAITILEPKGIKFLNDIQKSYRELNVTGASAKWMIKTIFVGYNDTGPAEYITNIRPLIFDIMKIGAKFTIEGGYYEISFVPIFNGTSKLKQFSNITDTIKIGLESNVTLKDAISNQLVSKINKKSHEHFEKVKNTLIEDGVKPKKITYEIILDKHFEDSAYIINDAQQQNKSSGTSASGCTLDFAKNITIENAINSIMKHCPKIKNDLTGTEENEKYGYKIRSIIDSNEEVQKVTYYITRYLHVYSETLNGGININQKTRDMLDENTLIFDYIYTGKNTDVLDFQMEIDDGLAFFTILTGTNNIGSQENHLSGNITTIDQNVQSKPSNVKNISKDVNKNPSVLVHAPVKSKNLDNGNSLNPKESLTYQELLSRQAQLENIEAKIKIHGNPTLLNSINKLPSSYGSVTRSVSNDIDGTQALPYWEQMPALCKINIKMPSSNKDFSTLETFWFDGFYKIFSIQTTFSDGAFTQELNIISVPNSENASADLSYASDKTQKSLLKDAAHRVTRYKGRSDLPNSIDTSKIFRFDEIKAIAEQVAVEEGIDVNLILGIIKQESSFRVNARGPSTRFGTALGLMQLLPGTAEEQGVSRNDLFVPLQNIRAGTRYIKKQLKKFGNVTEALAAYNAGPGNVGNPNPGRWKKFKETRNYVVLVQNHAKNFQAGSAREQLASNKVKELTTIEKTNVVVVQKPILNKTSVNDALNIHSSKTIT